MDAIIKAILKLIPFSHYLELWGLSKQQAAGLSVLITAVLLYFILIGLKRLLNYYKNNRIARKFAAQNLNFYFDYNKIKNSRRYFIPTQWQNISPTREIEPGYTTKHVSRSQLIPFFIDTVFNDKRPSDKFHLILADSGMGKTTFMINLYISYHSFFHFRRKYKIRLLPFGDEGIIEKIEQIKPEEARNTILLLDAFDEDKIFQSQAGDEYDEDKRFRKRMDEVIDAVSDFRDVVITSRTQYFPGQEKEDYELKIPRFDEKGFHILAKKYLSPFDEKDIKNYLNKKFGRIKFWNRTKKQKAASIVQNSPDLMVRPMLLSYIELLVESEREFNHAYEIYETLIEKWLDREALKRKHKSKDREKFKKTLLAYSQQIALEIYKHRKDNPALILNKEMARQVARDKDLDLKSYEITGQSLLTRDANSDWKFAHKSILEYFIAKRAIENIDFANEVDWSGLDEARRFFEEIIPVNHIRVKGGTIQIENKNITLTDFYICKYQVTQEEWISIMGKTPGYFKGEKLPIESVSWNDVQKYIKKLNEKTGKEYRLPSEAEWEFAARGGNRSKGFTYAGSNNLEEVGWYKKNSEGKTHPVGELNPNELGLYDMSGNVWEWTDTKEGPNRFVRGGGWRYVAEHCQVALRSDFHPDSRYDGLGFRLAHSL